MLHLVCHWQVVTKKSTKSMLKLMPCNKSLCMEKYYIEYIRDFIGFHPHIATRLRWTPNVLIFLYIYSPYGFLTIIVAVYMCNGLILTSDHVLLKWPSEGAVV